MEKTLIEITKAIHTFDEIKEAAKYKLEFLEKIEKSKRGIAKYEGSYCRSVFKENFTDSYQHDPERYFATIRQMPKEEQEVSLLIAAACGIDINNF